MRYALVVLTMLAMMAACSDSTGPTIDLQGTYDYAGPIDGISGSFTGTMTTFHDGGDTFDGSFGLAVAGGGFVSETIHGDLEDGELDGDGSIRFEAGGIVHDGEVSGRTISGSWIFVGSESTYSGTFTAVRR